MLIFAIIFSLIAIPPSSSPLSLHDALPISTFSNISCTCFFTVDSVMPRIVAISELVLPWASQSRYRHDSRSEEHTSELQSRLHLVCRLLLEKKKHNKKRRGLTEIIV